MNDEYEAIPGICKFCGQAHAMGPGVEDPDEIATISCECDMAVEYRAFQNAIKKIEDMFDNGAIVQLLQEQARHVHEKLVMGVTVYIDPETKVKINRTTKNKLKIKRTDTITDEVEA